MSHFTISFGFLRSHPLPLIFNFFFFKKILGICFKKRCHKSLMAFFFYRHCSQMLLRRSHRHLLEKRYKKCLEIDVKSFFLYKKSFGEFDISPPPRSGHGPGLYEQVVAWSHQHQRTNQVGPPPSISFSFLQDIHDEIVLKDGKLHYLQVTNKLVSYFTNSERIMFKQVFNLNQTMHRV